MLDEPRYNLLPLFIYGRTAGRLLLWLLACGADSRVTAQYHFDHWTTEHGLPQNSVNAITQTRDGYLWLATNEGLVRFDGLRFTVFKRSNTPGLENNRLVSLYEDRQGALWSGSDEGVLIRYQAGRFNSYTAQDGLPDDQLIHIEEDAAGSLWITGRLGHLIEYRDKRFLLQRPGEHLPGVVAPYEQRDSVWWSQDGRGVHLFKQGKLVTLTQQDGLPGLPVKSVQVDSYGILWIGTPAGFAQVKDGQMTVIPLSKNLPGGVISEDRQGNLWCFSHEQLRSLRAGVVTTHTEVRGDVVPQAFYQDREGSIWLGTAQAGLYRARRLPVRTLTEARGKSYNITNLVYSVLEDSQGNVWLGKNGGGLSRYREGRFIHYVGGEEWRADLANRKRRGESPPANLVFDEGLFNGRITSLYEDRAGVIWVGAEGGVSRVANGKLTRFSNQHGLAETYAILQDRAGDFWFATATGVTRLHNGQFTVYTTAHGLPANASHALLEDRQGRLWIGTYGGLVLWEQGRFSAWTERNGLAGQQIRNLYEDAQGTLWIATYDGGLTRFRNGRLTPYTSREGLFNDGVSYILDDGCGNFWLSCNRGIFRVNQEELNLFAAGRLAALTSVAYGVKDGMLNAECNGGRQPSGWRLRNGQLWFPTMTGVAIIDPATLPANPQPPPVVIEEVRLDQKVVPWQDALTIKPGQRNLVIQYTGNSLLQSEYVKFKYKLAGLNGDWIAAGTRRTASYDYLPPGNYEFKVTAANSDGAWNAEGRSVRIIVQPEIWQTWWFWSLSLLGVVMLVALGYRRRLGWLRREHAMKEAFSRDLLTTQENERARIALVLHDVLKPKLEEIRRATARVRPQFPVQEQAEAAFTRIDDEADRAIENIHDLIRVVRPPILEAGLTEALKALVSRAARSSRTRFADEVGNVDKLLPEELETQLYYLVEGAVRNVDKHAQATEARVSVRREADDLLVIIQDNGSGFDQEEVAARRARSDGFGLTGITIRAAILGGTPLIATAPGQGTTITLKLKLSKLSEGHDDHSD